MNSIDVAILDTEGDHVGELCGSTRTSHRRIRIESVLNFLWHFSSHWSSKDTRCYSCSSDTKFAQITSHWQNHTVDGALTSSIGNLTSLTFFSRNATDHENDASLSVNWLVFAHLNSSILRNVYRAQYIDLNDFLEDLRVQWSTRSESWSDPGDSRTS